MFEYSRAIYLGTRQLLDGDPDDMRARSAAILHAAEACIRRLEDNPDSYIDPSRWLYTQIRHNFALCHLPAVWGIVDQAVVEARRSSRRRQRERIDPATCAALTLTGERCRNRPLRGDIVCATHRYDAPLAGLPLAGSA